MAGKSQTGPGAETRRETLRFGVFGLEKRPLYRGARIHIRPARSRDYRQWSKLREQSRGFLEPWEPAWSPDGLSEAAFRRRLLRYDRDWREDAGYSFLVFANQDRALLGSIALSNVRRGVADTASLGYWIGQPHAHRGFMTEAVRLVLEFAFEELRLHRVEAACLPHNAPSRGLLRKSGFQEEGYARGYLAIAGRWQDHVLHAILAEDWQKRRSARFADYLDAVKVAVVTTPAEATS